MTAADRLAALDTLPARELCQRASDALTGLATLMNEETVLMRVGKFREAGKLTAEKTARAQDYVALSRAVQRQLQRLKNEAPLDVDALRSGHERLATQMAENLKVIATARAVTEDLLSDVAKSVGAAQRTTTYGVAGKVTQPAGTAARGIAVNRAL